MTSLLWFSRDLRLADNPALCAALARGGPVVAVFVLDDEEAGAWTPGGAGHWWLYGSLAALDADLRRFGNRLILRRGAAERVIDALLAETGADAVFWNRRYEPWARARTERLKTRLKHRGIAVESFNAALLAEPWDIVSQKGDSYRVFTPFWKVLQTRTMATPGRIPAAIPAPASFPASDPLDTWQLRPTHPDWAGGLAASWQPGERAAGAQLDGFMADAFPDYHTDRDKPGQTGTSRLSPHLHFGEIGPRQIWHRVMTAGGMGVAAPHGAAANRYLAEIAWREFSYHLLFHQPTMPEHPLRPAFADFPWHHDPAGLKAWQRGETGYPIVDAGMRELWQTGWMHNRVRMIVASFLIKDLLIDWRAGEAWFWDTLVDADLASNAASWQWVAGCGADAAPYFRIFNPSLQGQKFDPNGRYIRRWLPELARLPDGVIHTPWLASPLERVDAGITLGRTYPQPIIDHSAARTRALAALKTIQAQD